MLSVEKKRFIYILNLMRRRALKWIQFLLKEFLKKNKNNKGLFENFENFLAKIRIIFGIINNKEYTIRIIKTF